LRISEQQNLSPKGALSTDESDQAKIVDQVLAMEEGVRFQVLAPVVRTRKGEFVDLFSNLQQQGYSRVLVDGTVHQLTDPPTLKKYGAAINGFYFLVGFVPFEEASISPGLQLFVKQMHKLGKPVNELSLAGWIDAGCPE